MTEIIDRTVPQPLERFVLEWGEMGGQWGVSRSIGQVQALLYVSERPLTADEIVEALGIARSNVSTSLKELQQRGLVRRVPVRGERKEHFEAETDIWEVAARVAQGRKEREIDPALATLRACVAEAKDDSAVHPVALERLERMLEFTETVARWYDQMTAVPRPKLMALLRLGARVVALLPAKRNG